MRGAFARPRRRRFALPEPRRSVTRQMFNAALNSAVGAVASAAARKGVEKLNSATTVASTESTVPFS
jgi:hypothetical protein